MRSLRKRREVRLCLQVEVWFFVSPFALIVSQAGLSGVQTLANSAVANAMAA